MEFIFRKATKNDLIEVIELLADDEFGKIRENSELPIAHEYLQAFEIIDSDPNQELIVVEDKNGEIIGTLQLSFLQYLTYRGGKRAQVEAVRIRKDRRGFGVGKRMLKWTIERAKDQNAHLLQLTTDKKRLKAINFYKDLGLKETHAGMKIHFNLNG